MIRRRLHLDAELAFFLLKDDEAAGAASRATKPAEHAPQELLRVIDIVERLGGDVDTNDIIVSRNDDARFCTCGHNSLLSVTSHWERPLAFRAQDNLDANDRV
jgi:hypothetical protein